MAIRYDESAGLYFVQSGHRQRNRPSPSVETSFETIVVERSEAYNPTTAFFNTFVHLGTLNFDLIPQPRTGFDAHYWESDLQTPPGSTDYPDGYVWIDSFPDGVAGETVPYLPGNPHQFLSHLLPPGSNILNGADKLAYNVKHWSNVFVPSIPGLQSKSYYSSRKSRFRYSSSTFAAGTYPTTGFVALGTIVYREIDFGLGIFVEPISVKDVVIERLGAFAPNVWHVLEQPAAFNFFGFRFAIVGETPAEWTARTGIPTS
jgi:hypothetical protein